MDWPDLFAPLKVSLILKGEIKVWVEVCPQLREIVLSIALV